MNRRLPGGIWLLGLASLCMDLSSELIHSLLPVFMARELGLAMVAIGLVEGLGEATATLIRAFSGALSDRWRRRKPLLLLGYGLAAAAKPLFPLAQGLGWVLSARLMDRLGKGIRGAPRDALVADLAPRASRGAAFGLRQALDSVGALLGPLAALGLMLLLAGDIRAVLWFALLPAFGAVILLALFLKEPAHPTEAPRQPFRWRQALRLPGAFWWLLLLAALFTLARFSEAFLILRVQQLGLALPLVPLVLVVMNLAYAAFAYPAGIAADALDHRRLLLLGLMLLLAADLLLALARTPATALAGALFWGLHMAFTQGLFAKLVADTAPAALRGTAFGLFGLITGLVVLLASLLAGGLWQWLGPQAPFLAGAGFTLLTALVLLLGRR
ncbi:MFS transporter [Gallaecimonas sp. GXIMD4217]|uniref:MFS transporter n=2 Tax=Gallaecimonas sp. GXIMD4217 TaxID=3131927 RepID=UPI00311AFC92